MKRNWLSVFLVLLFFAVLAVPAQAWQGRMAGVGDAYGLIEDESDYLTHPAVIAMSKGFNAYGHYRLTYNKTSKWDSKWDVPDVDPIDGDYHSYNVDGYEWKHEGLVGAAFQLGAGRMGVFLEYTGINGKYKGDEDELHYGTTYYYTIAMKDRLNNYSLRLIYGLPVGAVNVGAEVQLAYRDEEKKTIWDDEYVNYPEAASSGSDIYELLYHYMIPFKSRYWEAQGKVSLSGLIGKAKYAFTFKGGVPFASDNKYIYLDLDDDYSSVMKGKVKGFNVGGDFWLRVPLSSTVVLPFLVSAGYKQTKRDGAGWDSDDYFNTYKQKGENLFIRVGGGMDFTSNKGTKLALGLYYDYLAGKEDIKYDDDGTVYSYRDSPEQVEHRLTLKMLAEKELTPVFVLRGGMSAFYGWVNSDYAFDYDYGYYLMSVSPKGSHMGVNASVGATVKLGKVTLEPFLNAGYAQYSIDGDGNVDGDSLRMELDKVNWLVGGGLSLRF